MPLFPVPLTLHYTAQGVVEIEAACLRDAHILAQSGVDTDLIYPPDIAWTEIQADRVEVADFDDEAAGH